MKTLIIAATIAFTANVASADHYRHNHNHNHYDNHRFEQEADWVRNQHKYKRMHAQDYRRQQHQQHHDYQQNSDSDVSLMLGIILGAMVANSNR